MTVITEQRKSQIALGFIGVGWIGKNRMEALVNCGLGKAELICDPSVQNAQQALLSCPGAKLSLYPEDVYEDDGLEGVIIATPSALHAEQSIKALNSGKAVFCQKPLGRTAEEVTRVVEASKINNRYLAVDLSYRYTKAFQAVHKLIVAGEIGEIYAVDLVFHNAYGPDKEWFYDIQRSGGGCVMDLGVHLVDMALLILDFPEIKKVDSDLYHHGQKLRSFDQQVEDFARVSMATQNDISINLQCSWNLSVGKDALIEAHFYGVNGTVAFRNINGSFYDFKAEKYVGNSTETLMSPPDEWSGRAGIEWAKKVSSGMGYDPILASEYVQTAEIIDRIYGR